MFGTYRTLLALMVVALHLGGIPRIGNYAVFGFYILSGYLMTLIMQTNYGYSTSGILKYAKNRFLRVYPIYWFSITVSSLLILTVGEEVVSSYHHSITFPEDAIELAKNIFLFFPSLDSSRLTPPAWALTVEIVFYILIGLGISKNKKIVLLWLTISISYHILAISNNLDHYFSIAAASLPFSTGAAIYHYREKLTDIFTVENNKIIAYIPLIIFASMIINWYAGYLVETHAVVFFYINYIICSLMIITLQNQIQLPLISKKIDKWIGDFSYPIYLIHYQTGLIIVVLMGYLGVSLTRPSTMLMFISIPLTLIFSWLIIVLLEKPVELVRVKIKNSLVAPE